MLQVRVQMGKGQNRQQGVVIVHGFDRLTPRAARAALSIAGYVKGEVWIDAPITNGHLDYSQMYGYRVYAHSARKVRAS